MTQTVTPAALGYYVFCTEGDALWDGTLHPTLEAAQRELTEALSNPSDYGTGWYIAECRPIASIAADSAVLRNEIASIVQDRVDGFALLSERYGVAEEILRRYTLTPKEPADA